MSQDAEEARLAEIRGGLAAHYEALERARLQRASRVAEFAGMVSGWHPTAVPWRTGKSIHRTIYACPPGSSYRDGEVVIGMMDTPELAEAAVFAHNRLLGETPALPIDGSAAGAEDRGPGGGQGQE